MKASTNQHNREITAALASIARYKLVYSMVAKEPMPQRGNLVLILQRGLKIEHSLAVEAVDAMERDYAPELRNLNYIL